MLSGLTFVAELGSRVRNRICKVGGERKMAGTMMVSGHQKAGLVEPRLGIRRGYTTGNTGSQLEELP